jgi:hypothetical protein
VSCDIQELFPHLQEEVRPKSHDQTIEDLDVPILVCVNEFSEDEKIDNRPQRCSLIFDEPLECLLKRNAQLLHHPVNPLSPHLE